MTLRSRLSRMFRTEWSAFSNYPYISKRYVFLVNATSAIGDVLCALIGVLVAMQEERLILAKLIICLAIVLYNGSFLVNSQKHLQMACICAVLAHMLTAVLICMLFPGSVAIDMLFTFICGLCVVTFRGLSARLMAMAVPFSLWMVYSVYYRINPVTPSIPLDNVPGFGIITFAPFCFVAYNLLSLWYWMDSRDNGREEFANQRLAEAEALTDSALSYVNNISHDMRDMMTPILGNLAQAVPAEGYVKLAAQSFEDISLSTANLTTLLDNLNDYSRDRTGRYPGVKFEILDPSALFSQVVQMKKILSDRKSLSVSLKTYGLPHKIMTERMKLFRIINNLLSNAIKYTPDNGEILVEAVADVEKETLHITVLDNGPGFSNEKWETLFTPFEHSVGTGLGLPIAHQFIEDLQGEITVQQGAEGGTSFEIMIPYVSVAHSVLHTASTEQPMSPVKICLVGIPIAHRLKLTWKLNQMNIHNVIYVPHMDALRLSHYRPQVVIIDADDESGYTPMLNYIRKSMAPSGIYIVAASADPASSTGLSADDTLRLPANADDLQRKIRKALKFVARAA